MSLRSLGIRLWAGFKGGGGIRVTKAANCQNDVWESLFVLQIFVSLYDPWKSSFVCHKEH